jgi:nicotinate-nucleotide--dimethylbenzimidazole phosphoribosyltransferase
MDSPLSSPLSPYLSPLSPLYPEAVERARARQQRLTKPAGSLGRLEDLSLQIAGITGQIGPQLRHKVILVMAADHGVAAERVSAYPQAVTAQMVGNFLRGGAAVNVLARQANARVVVVDIGVAADLPDHPQLIRRKVAYGTRNLAREPAMTPDQTLEALRVGADTVEAEAARGLDVLVLGEMGIANTTSAAAIAVAITGCAPSEAVGQGTGVDAAGLARKVAVIRQALDRHRPRASDPLDVLTKLGGLEIAGLAGAALAAATRRIPIVLDGYPATAAALIAAALDPQIRPYLIAGHRSTEPGHAAMLRWLGLEPLLDLGLRLGEGTGAALALSLIDAACALLREMATFEEAGVAGKELA